MKPLVAFFQSSIGKKWIVALTGVVLVLFVIGHMLGNLQIFLGQETINVYAEKLQSLGDLLWVIRIFLLVVIVLHIFTTVRLAIQSAAARGPQKYAVKKNVGATTAAKTMLLSGLVLISFIIFHILHFTAQTVQPEWKTWVDEAGRHDVYSMMIAGFQSPLVSGFYILAVFLLCLHMSHGIQSFLQTLGGRTRGFAPAMSKASVVIAWLTFLGYASIPVAVLLGVLTLKAH
jgi:succinate dehydrogenase / fumarate reductase cytochrome b subunit